MTQDELIIEQFNSFLETSEYHFFTHLPIFKRLQEIELIGCLPEPTKEILYSALGEIKQNKQIMHKGNMDLSGDGVQIGIQGIKHRIVISKANQINEKLAVKQVFQKLKDEGKHIGSYLKL